MPDSSLIEPESEIIDKVLHLYGRDKECLQEDVTTLRVWMESQPHLPEILDFKRIQNFLFLNKCSIERAKQSIDTYYTIRSKIPEIFEKSNPKCEDMKKHMEIFYWVILPKPTKEMYRVQLFKMRDKNLIDIMQPVNVLTWGLNMQEFRLKNDVMYGDVYIFDMEGITFNYMTKFTPSFLAKVVAVYEKVYRIPLKGAYFVNSPSYISTLIAILQKLIKPKLFERVYVCEDTSVLERLPKEILPKEYGGDERSLDELQDSLNLKLAQFQDRFDKLDKLRVDESLRPQKLENDDILGFHGNFKKLNASN